MPTEIIGIIGLVLVIVLMFLRVPLGIAFALVGGAGLIMLGNLGGALERFATIPYTWTTEYSFSCLPMFILMGLLIASTGIAKDLFSAAYKWMGNWPGGLAMTTLLVTAGFSAISGSSIAAASTISVTCYPEMRRYNYSKSLSSGVIASGATMDIMIPPSLPMIIYGIVAEVSISQMFIAGIGPGILEVLIFCVTILIMVKIKPSIAPRAAVSFPLIEKLKALKTVLPIIIIFILVIGGMYAGIFTPTEAGAMGVAASAIVCLIMRRLTWKGVKRALFGTVSLTGSIFMILIGVMFFNTFITISHLSTALGEWIAGAGITAIGFVAIILFLYLILGALMDEFSMMMLTLPLFLPTATALGIDLVWFGILVIVAWQIGFIAPPVGLIVFITKSILPDVTLGEVYRGCLPFIVGLIIVEALIIFMPDIALFPLHFMK